ncbi:MAG: hypothetical protein HYV29_00755 [Ignavibacteriales bacterium]|nr:hypothetical protein [Ignavibacteriales bacterium]
MRYTVLLLALLVMFGGCNDDSSAESNSQNQSTTTDAQLYMLGKNAAGFTFYKNSTDTLVKNGGSGHPDSHLRTRYNAIAAQHLDANGKVKAGTVFADSSLIVKELINNGVLTTYVFLFKKKGDANADANGWVWAETSPTGTPTYPVTNKGAGCIGCHSAGIDYTRMNDTHP